MREIKFRAFSELRGMIDLHETPSRVTILTWPTIRDCEYNADHKQVDLPLMQYTGLKDKNDVEIYEGDIVSLDGRETFIEFAWSGCGYFFECGTPISDYSDIDVVGNIYQNPELLEISP